MGFLERYRLPSSELKLLFSLTSTSSHSQSNGKTSSNFVLYMIFISRKGELFSALFVKCDRGPRDPLNPYETALFTRL